MNLEVDYPEIGATQDGPLPPGYRHLRRETELEAPLVEAAEILMTWGLHERCGLRPRATAPRAETGAKVRLRFALLPIPCQVVWTVEGPERTGFTYGSLPGHPERGEAAFILEPVGPHRTRFEVRSFSRPGRWLTRLAGPASRTVQTIMTDRFTTRMRLACAN